MNTLASQYDLYAEFGIAAEKAQVLEVDAGNVAMFYLALVFKTVPLPYDQREVIRGVLDDCDRSTLGKLLRWVKGTGEFDERILQAVDEALERRNYLMHRFFRAHNFAILSDAGRKEMITELKEIQAKLELAHVMLDGIATLLQKLSGLDKVPEEIVKQLEQIQQQGKRVDL